MLTFFRINSIFQVITLLIILVLFRFPYFGNPLPMLTSELEWMLIGEKLNEGLRLYSGILTQVGPLSSYFYQMMDYWFGKSQFYYELVAAVFVFIQTLYFVFIVNRRDLFNEKSYVSGLFYLVIMNVSFDMFKLSPALLANFFVLIALNVILRQIEKRDGLSDDIFEAGLFLGVATLFDLPCAVFMIWALITLALYTAINIRQIFMVMLAFIMPIFFTYLFFYFSNHGSDFTNIWLFNIRNSFDLTLAGIKDILVSFTIPFVLAFLGVFRVLRGTRYNSFQNRGHQLLIVYAFFSLVSLFFSQNFTPSNFIFVAPFLAFYCTGFFIHSRKTFAPELIALAFVAIVLFIDYVGVTGRFNSFFESSVNQRVTEENLPPKYANKNIFVTGEHIDAYKNNKMATGYLSWKLSKNDFLQPNNYVSLVNIYNNLKKDLPQVIIDKENVMPNVFKSVPDLGAKYTKTDKNIYELKN